jgi:hypothetical protein
MDRVSKREQLNFRRDRHRNRGFAEQNIPERGVELRGYPPLNSQFTYYHPGQSNNAPTTSYSPQQPQAPPQRPGTPDPYQMERQAERLVTLERAYNSLQRAYAELNLAHGALKGTNVKLRQNLFVVKSELKETKDQNQRLKEMRRDDNKKMRLLEALTGLDHVSEEMEGFFNGDDEENTTSNSGQDNERYMSDVELEDEEEDKDKGKETPTELMISGAFSNLRIRLRDGKDEMDISK